MKPIPYDAVRELSDCAARVDRAASRLDTIQRAIKREREPGTLLTIAGRPYGGVDEFECWVSEKAYKRVLDILAEDTEADLANEVAKYHKAKDKL